MTDQKHKTRLVTGGLSGTNDIANDAGIVNHFTENTTPFSKAVCVLGNRGYNADSYIPKQYPRTESVFFNAPNNTGLFAHLRTGAYTSLGDAVSGNAPTVFGSRTSPTLLGGSKFLKPKVFIMNKLPKSQKSTASIQHTQFIDGTTALEQPTPDTLTPEQALERTFEKVHLFAAYVYINGGVDKDDITRGVPHFVGHYTDKEEAESAGLKALAHTEGAVCSEVKDVSDMAWKLTMEGVDSQGWVTGMAFYLPTEQRALEYAQELFDRPRYGLKFKTARIKNLKLDFFAGVAQPPKHYLTNYAVQDEQKGGEL